MIKLVGPRVAQIFFFFFFDLIYLAESYSTYNKNIVRTYIYNNNKYHMYILSKKPRITQKVVKLISIVVSQSVFSSKFGVESLGCSYIGLFKCPRYG